MTGPTTILTERLVTDFAYTSKKRKRKRREEGGGGGRGGGRAGIGFYLFFPYTRRQ